jgi:basic membrane protein A
VCKLRVYRRAFVSLVVSAVLMTACGGQSSPTVSSGGGASGGPASSGHAAGFRVALVVSDLCNDHSWGQAHCTGAQAAAANTGAELVVAEQVGSPQDALQQGAAFAEQGYDLIVVANGGVPQAVHQLAEQFPDTMFCQHGSPMDGYDVNYLPNLCTYLDQFQQGSFVAGALAGYLTKTNRVAHIGGNDFSVINLAGEAFRLGARYVNPEVKSEAIFTLDLYDTAKGKAAAEAQIAAGADFIFSGTDEATVGMMAAAEEAGPGHYVIPQYWDSNFLSPTTVITSATMNLKGATQSIIEMGVKGELTNKHYEFGTENGSLELSPYYLQSSVVPADVDRKVKLISSMIASGELVVPVLPVKDDSTKVDLSTFPPPPD